MSLKLFCWLCYTPSSDYKTLQNEEGESNKAYEITVRYFDPMFLTVKENSNLQESKVLCLNCWENIIDFHEFQQNIIEIRTLLEKSEIKQLQSIIKAENVNVNFEDDKDLANSDDNEDYQLEDNIKNEMEFFDDSTKTNDEEDENPLITLMESKSFYNQIGNLPKDGNRNGKAITDSKKEKHKVQSGRKRKNIALDDGSAYLDESYMEARKQQRTLLEKSEIKLQSIIKVDDNIALEDVNVNFEDDKELGNSFDNKDYQLEDNIKNETEIFDMDMTNSNDPLITLMDSKSFDNKIENLPKDGNRNGKISTDRKKDKPKVRSGRKRKNIPLEDGSAHLDQSHMETKKQQLTEENKTEKTTSKLNLEKARESDAFISKWKPVLECDLCEETTCSFDNLRSHFREKHKSRFYIKCCERKFYRRYVLVNHIQLHLKPDTHKCDICGKVSANKNNLKLHKKLMHEDIEQLECNVCHKLFNLKASLDRHLLTHVTGDKDFVCQDCGKAYVLEVQLKSHVKTVHNVDRVCDQCGKTVHGIQALKKHLMEHAGIARPKFPCDECGVELITRNSLKRHKAAYHHDGSTIYVCGICGKVAASENALLNHKKYVHEEERKHKCTYCDKAFKRPKNLLEHIATHTGQDLYQCPHCPQTFKVSANMHHHRKKVHPVEWEEGRRNRLKLPKVDINHAKNQVVL